LQEYIKQAGGNPSELLGGKHFLNKENVRAFIEVHIEQAPSLVHSECPIGIATAIPGNFRYPEATVIGEYGHVGLHRRFRADAALAVADLFTQLDRTWEEWDGAGRGMAFTMGRVHTESALDALTKVAGECKFSLDVRAYNQCDIDALSGMFASFVSEIEARRGVKFELGARTEAEPAEMDRKFMNSFESIARELGLPTLRMGSPASHDAAAFFTAGIPIGMILIRNQNGSHNPQEAMEIEDFLAATTVLTCWLRDELTSVSGDK
jgi:N-carbamoyl-L-amino-acid hydrolase